MPNERVSLSKSGSRDRRASFGLLSGSTRVAGQPREPHLLVAGAG